MKASLRLIRADNQAWAVATRLSPVVVQFVLALLLISTWLVGKATGFPNGDGAIRAELLAAIGITVVVSLFAAVALLRRDSARVRGIGLSAAASAAITLVGGTPYAIWLF